MWYIGAYGRDLLSCPERLISSCERFQIWRFHATSQNFSEERQRRPSDAPDVSPMPRLRVDEEPQHGVTTGAPVVRRAPPSTPKRPSPRTNASGAKKHRHCPSPRSQAVIAVKAAAACGLPPKQKKRQLAAISSEHDVGIQYPRKVARRIAKTEKLVTPSPAPCARTRLARARWQDRMSFFVETCVLSV